MKVLFINNDGGGFADYIEVADGLTVAELFRQQIQQECFAKRIPRSAPPVWFS